MPSEHITAVRVESLIGDDKMYTMYQKAEYQDLEEK